MSTPALINLTTAEARLRQAKPLPNSPTKPSEGLFSRETPPFVGSLGDQGGSFSWNEPKPLPSGLLQVDAFDYEILPRSLAPWVADISERMQCPHDFLGATAMVGLGAVLGRKVGIRPQSYIDWLEVPNLWGCVIARPRAMKSSAMSQAFAPIHRLEARAREENETAAKVFATATEAHKLRMEDAGRRAKSALKNGLDISNRLDIDEPEEPKSRRYIVTDATYESLEAIMSDNPNGVLAFRDGLVSLLKTLDREEYAPAPDFYLTGWNGTSGYTFDRIIRGRTHIEAACISLMGSTQPPRFAEYIRRAVRGGAGDDGLVQRFGLLVWPDQQPEWKDVGRYPDSAARAAAWETLRHLDELSPDAIGAEADEFESIPFLRLKAAASAVFREWRETHERKLIPSP